MYLNIFKDLHVLSPPEYRRWFLKFCLYVWTSALLAPEWLDGFHSYSVFKSLPQVGSPLNMNILAPKQGPSEQTPQTKMAIFLKMALIIMIKFWYFMETYSLNKIA